MSIFSVEDKGIKFNSAADIEPFLHDLHDDVREIRLSGNTFGVEASIRLAEALQNKQHLENAQMADIFTGRLREEIPAALEALLPALASCVKLHTVNLSDNAFGPTAALPLESFLASHAALRHLYLQNNGMGPDAGARMARALARNTGAALETIICGRNRLEDGSVAAWIMCFAAHATLKTIKLPQNGMRPHGIQALLRDGLSRCPRLETLDLQDNTFTARGSVALAHALPTWTALTQLAVGDCLLSARGGLALAEALQRGHNKALTIVRLQYNEIEARGLAALKAAVQYGLPALATLELNGNKFAEDDASLDQIRALFEDRGVGEMDELDDLEEDSEGDEEGDDNDDDDDDEEEEQAESTEVTSATASLDAAIEKNLAAALGATSINS